MFKKKSYSDLEIQEIMESLFLEKKKVNELQLQLNNCTLSPSITPSSEELEKLNHEIKELKRSLQESTLKEQSAIQKVQELQTIHSERNKDFFTELEPLKIEIKKLLSQIDEKNQNEFRLKEELRSLLIKQEEFNLREQLALQRQQAYERELVTLKEQKQTNISSAINELELAKFQIQKLTDEISCLNEEAKAGSLRERLLEKKQQELESELKDIGKLNFLISNLTKEIDEKTLEIQKLTIQLQNKPSYDKQKEAQLERAAQVMRAKVEEIQSENQLLLQKFTEMETADQNMKEKLAVAIHEKEQAEEEKQLILEEEEALKAQLDQLYKEIERMRACIDEALTCRQEAEHLKTEMAKALQESKEERRNEEQSYQNQILILNDLYEKEKESRSNLEHLLKEQAAVIQQQQEQFLHDKEKFENEFSEEIKSKTACYEEAKTFLQEHLNKKEEIIHNLSHQITNLTKAHEKVEELLKIKESEEQEQEAHLRAAQQHLAKKMREAALLAEQNQELKEALVAQEKAFQSSQTKLGESIAKLNEETAERQTLSKLHEERLKTFETQCQKWEEKYLQMQERGKALETQNKELRKMEERFSKLQKLFHQLGSIITPSSLHESNELPTFETIPPAIKKFPEMEIISTDPLTPQHPSLFEPLGKSHRFKDSLFG